MKLFRSLMLGLTLLVGLTLLEAPQAHAGNIILRAAGAEDPASNGASRVNNTGTNHKYVTVDFPTGATETCTLFHFGLFTDYAINADITGSLWFTTSGTSTNTAQVRLDVACVTASANYNTTALTSGTAFNLLPSGVAGQLGITGTLLSTAINETTAGCTAAKPVVLRLCRTASDGGTPNPDTLKFVQTRLEY